uniref:Ig-like domain-containing protein n=1 Tax=Periophthalmus magnuspinnatus TaxID=409849 RepID=A0A3B4AHB0_9GOBI
LVIKIIVRFGLLHSGWGGSKPCSIRTLMSVISAGLNWAQHKESFLTVGESSETFTFENEGVTLYCDISDADSYMVHWYRRLTPQQPELMYDSGDESVPIPEDLRGRWKISDDDSAFTLLNARREDEGVYWCVVLRGTIFLEDDDDYGCGS